MEKKNPFEVKFHNEYVNLMDSLLKIFKSDRDVSKMLKGSYVEYKNKYDRFSFIHQTVENMSPFIEGIRSHDDTIFCEGDAKPVKLLPNLDFRSLWGHHLMEEDHKTVIWGYLKNLYVLGCHYGDRQDEHLKNIINGLKFDQLIKKEMDKENQQSGESSKLSQEISGLFQELFGEDSFVHELLKLEEVKEIIGSFKQNPMKLAKQYLQNDGKRIREVLQSISGKIKEKILNGELDKEKMERDLMKIRHIMNKLKMEIPNDPRMKKIFDHIKKAFNVDFTSDNAFNNPEEVIQQFSKKFENMSGISIEKLSSQSPDELQDTLKQFADSDSALGKMLNQMGDKDLQQRLFDLFKEVGTGSQGDGQKAKGREPTKANVKEPAKASAKSVGPKIDSNGKKGTASKRPEDVAELPELKLGNTDELPVLVPDELPTLI